MPTAADIEALDRALDQAAQKIYTALRRALEAGPLTSEEEKIFAESIQAFETLLDRVIDAVEKRTGTPARALRVSFEVHREAMRKRVLFMRGLH